MPTGMPPLPTYPNDENQWNDEIVYQLIPGMLLTPAVQASTGTAAIQAANSTFKITARVGAVMGRLGSQ